MIPVRDDLPDTYAEAVLSGWERIAAGCTREVMIHEDYPGLVLKMTDSKHNKVECEIWEGAAEGAFGFVLTPIVGRSDDYSAILMKRMPAIRLEEITEPIRAELKFARGRTILRMWDSPNMSDFHAENWAYMSDDYGYAMPGKLVDYAGC
jgi:hypothetical protein